MGDLRSILTDSDQLRPIKRGADVVGIFPNENAIVRLVGALLFEQNDECAVQRGRYMTRLVTSIVPNDVAPQLLGLVAALCTTVVSATQAGKEFRRIAQLLGLDAELVAAARIKLSQCFAIECQGAEARTGSQLVHAALVMHHTVGAEAAGYNHLVIAKTWVHGRASPKRYPREDSHADFYDVAQLDRPGNPRSQGFSEALRSCA